MKSFAIATLALISGAIAAPAADAASVTNYPVKNGCSLFPGYTAGSNVSSPFDLQLVQSKAPVNNNGLATITYYDNDKGRLILPVGNDLAKLQLRCNQTANGPNGAPSIEAYLGPSGWVPLQIFAPVTGIDINADNAQLVYGALSNVSQPALAYTHDKAGKNGIFIGGADKSTNFAARVEYLSSIPERSFYSLRYVPTGGNVGDAEYTGYAKVLSF